MRKKTGTFENDAVMQGKRLWMFSTDMEFSSFASLICDPETCERFEEVSVTHICREMAEPAYSQELNQRADQLTLFWDSQNDLQRISSISNREWMTVN